MLKTIYFSVTTDLVHDQRMIRICSSLQANGYKIVLIGRKSTTPLTHKPYQQVRLTSWFSKGKLLYLEYNIRLFVYLLTAPKPDMMVAIDLDSIIPVYLASTLRSTQRGYDGHEWFSEMKEVISRKHIQRIWKWVEKTFVPRFPIGYTVSHSISEAFKHRYQVHYPVIMNATVLTESKPFSESDPPYLLYQGAVNEGRCLEWLIPAMQSVDMPLWICGDGNFMERCKQLIHENGLSDKVLLKGKKTPQELSAITRQAYAGINLIEPYGQNQLMSLANKFFDYFHAGIPQLTMNFPEYKRINDDIEVAVLIDKPEIKLIADQLNNLIHNKVLYETLSMNCVAAAKKYNWQVEERKLLTFYNQIFNQDY